MSIEIANITKSFSSFKAANFKFKLATLVILLLGLTKKLINQYE